MTEDEFKKRVDEIAAIVMAGPNVTIHDGIGKADEDLLLATIHEANHAAEQMTLIDDLTVAHSPEIEKALSQLVWTDALQSLVNDRDMPGGE